MISVEAAKTGVPVLRKNGRLLDSSVDPEREAQSWLAKQQPIDAAVNQIVVLGLGSGYQCAALLQALKKRNPVPDILLIENDPEVVQHALEIFPSLRSVPVVIVKDWPSLVQEALFRDAVCGVYRVYYHGASAQGNSEFYNGAQELLRGRDQLSFLHLLKTRPEMMSLLKPESILRIPDQAVSVRTIVSMFQENSANSRERRMWRVLEELIR